MKKTLFILSIILFKQNLIAQYKIDIVLNKSLHFFNVYNASLFSNSPPINLCKANTLYSFQNIVPSYFVLKTADVKQIPFLFSQGEKYLLNENNGKYFFENKSTNKQSTYTNIISQVLSNYTENPLLFNKSDTILFPSLHSCLQNLQLRLDSFYISYNYLKSISKNQDFVVSDNYLISQIDFTKLQYIYLYLLKESKHKLDLDLILNDIYTRLKSYNSIDFMEVALSSHIFLKIQLLLRNQQMTLQNEYDLVNIFFEKKNSLYTMKFLLLNSVKQNSAEIFNKLITELDYSDIPNSFLTIFQNLKIIKESLSYKFIDYSNKGKSLNFYLNLGKLIYIDVWASWCKPCIEELMNSKKNIYKYDSTKFIKLTISLDRDINSWKNAVINYNLDKKNSFFAVDNFTSLFAKRFNITTIPRYILIGKDGKVISADAPRPSDPKLKTLIDKYINQ